MPKKIAKCLDCGLVKTIVAKGLCNNCYGVMLYRKSHPLNLRICKCGCGQTFTPKNRNQIYVNKSHERQYHNAKTRAHYEGVFICPNCQKEGFLYTKRYKKTLMTTMLFYHTEKHRFRLV